MSLSNIMIKDSNLYATSATQVDKPGTGSTTLGDGGQGWIRGTDWYAYATFASAEYDLKFVREQKVDLQGLEYNPIATLGFDIIESEAPSFYGLNGTGYMREYSILSSQRMNFSDLTNRIELFSAPLPFDEYRAGYMNDNSDRDPLMTREQCLGGRSQYYALDSSLPVTLGVTRKISSYDLNMGSEVSTNALFYYRVIYVYGNKTGVANNVVFVDLAARTTIATINIREDADDTQIATGMIRAYQAPTFTGTVR